MRETRLFSALVAVAVAGGTVLAVAAPATAVTDTTTTLTSSANPSASGQAVTLTASVAGDTPTGEVVFAEPGRTPVHVSLTSGVATLTVSSLSVGDHALTATYNGDLNNNASVGTLTQTVAAPPTVKLAASATKASVGDKVRLRWRSKHADSVIASGDWKGARPVRGSAAIRITSPGKHVFKLTVHNDAGKDTATIKVLAVRKAKTLPLVVTDELTMVGSDVDVTADGLAKGEEYTIRLDGKPVLTGKADRKGDVARSFTLPKTTPEGALALTITGSNPGRLGSAVLNVIAPKELDVVLALPEASKKYKQTVTVNGLAAGESVTVVYRGKTLTTGTADADGTFMYEFRVGRHVGEQTVKVVGADPSRSGTATFTVTEVTGGETRHL